jgi:hypothetical protein
MSATRVIAPEDGMGADLYAYPDRMAGEVTR